VGPCYFGAMAPNALSLFVAAAAVLFYLFRREQAKRLAHDFVDGLERAIDRFRGGGGPTTPMHPSPAGDVTHLRKPRVRC
jgi:hypothetical protein